VKTRPFLRDVDDPALFADMLENVYLLLYEELGDTLAKFPLLKAQYPEWDCLELGKEHAATYEELARIRHTMSLLIRDMAERKKRLRDVAVGLTDVHLDK